MSLMYDIFVKKRCIAILDKSWGVGTNIHNLIMNNLNIVLLSFIGFIKKYGFVLGTELESLTSVAEKRAQTQ